MAVTLTLKTAPGTPLHRRIYEEWREGILTGRFRRSIWHRLMNRPLIGAAGELFDYADSPAGYPPLRREIAAYLARSRAVTCTPDQVLVVNGSQQGLDLCVRILLDRGDEVAL